MGYPGLSVTGVNVKLAQQNYGEHYRVIKSLAEKFHPDVIFPIMDLSVEANAFGRYTVFPKDDSATVVKDHFEIDELEIWKQINISLDSRLLGYVETMKLMSIGMPKEIIRGAYVAGPYSLAALIMGADDAAMATIMEPDKLHRLCEFVTESIQLYSRLLIGAGAQVICILEPSAVMLGPDQFLEFSSHYVSHISRSCRYNGVNIIYHTCGNTMHLIENMAQAGVNGISLDSSETGVNLPAVAERVPPDVAIIGNINPTTTILNGKPEDVSGEVTMLLRAMDKYPNFILSTGCDLPQETPLDNIGAFMETGKNYCVS
ncbi:MAG: uroporphyrinogen decarboxylase family protein [Candidatus Latescibacteria bacterium]|nr:uroporphyrinogen decarboxylase family protein [Candidatus Latescibacterota bacterium]